MSLNKHSVPDYIIADPIPIHYFTIPAFLIQSTNNTSSIRINVKI